jgi:murein DD-endopeptidase MepM/ murein hydrolase activator NlpD
MTGVVERSRHGFRAVAAGVLVVVATALVPAQAGWADDPTTTSSSVPDTTTTTTTLPTTTVPGATTTTTILGPDVATGGDAGATGDLIAGYDEAVASEADLLSKFDATMKQLQSLSGDLMTLNAKVTTVENEMLDAQTNLIRAENRADLADSRLRTVRHSEAAARRLLNQQVVEAYVYGDVNPALAALMSAESVQQLDVSRTYASAVDEHTQGLITNYVSLKADARRLAGEADSERERAQRARDEVQTRRDALEKERDDRAKTQADAFLAALNQKDLIAQVKGARIDYENRLRSLQGTSDSIDILLAKRQKGENLPDDTKGIFLAPVPNPKVVSPFGPRVHPIFGTIRMHTGADIEAAEGTPVRAAEDGIVVMTGFQGGYGNVVVIDHGNGLATVYAHLSSIGAHVGDQVEMGDIVAKSGHTGWATGPHVHFEVRVFGKPTDPVPFIGGEDLLKLHEKKKQQQGK